MSDDKKTAYLRDTVEVRWPDGLAAEVRIGLHEFDPASITCVRSGSRYRAELETPGQASTSTHAARLARYRIVSGAV